MATTCNAPILGGPASTMTNSLVQALITAHCALTIPSIWPEDYGLTGLDDLDSYDFVVIGSGAAGSAVASRLSENTDWKIMLLETGHDPPTESYIPSLYSQARTGFRYLSESVPGNLLCAGSTMLCAFPEANVMGGKSSIDPMVSHRGNKKIFDSWNLPGWSWEEALKYYNLAERSPRPGAKSTGHFVVNDFDVYNSCHVQDMIFGGAQELGLKKLGHVRDSSKVGYGYVSGHLEHGVRMGAGRSYLSPAKSRKNLHVVKNAQARKINFDSNKNVESVTFVYQGPDGSKEVTVAVDKEVIVAAGAINTPKLLMLSGIGPKADLNTLNIPVVTDLPGVGQNLQTPVSAFVPFQLEKGTAKEKTAEEIETDTFQYLSNKYGPLNTIGTFSLSGFIGTDAQCSIKNCQYPDAFVNHLFFQRKDNFLQLWLDSMSLSSGITTPLETANQDGHLMLSFTSLQNPKSRGSVQLRSANYDDSPKINHGFLSDSRDQDALFRGFQYQMQLEQTKAYKQKNAQMIELGFPECNVLTFKSDDYWRCHIKYTLSPWNYAVGTAKMGLDSDENAVLDLELKVRGVNGVRVVGKSALPTIITTSDASVMMAEKLSVMLRNDYL